MLSTFSPIWKLKAKSVTWDAAHLKHDSFLPLRGLIKPADLEITSKMSLTFAPLFLLLLSLSLPSGTKMVYRYRLACFEYRRISPGYRFICLPFPVDTLPTRATSLEDRDAAGVLAVFCPFCVQCADEIHMPGWHWCLFRIFTLCCSLLAAFESRNLDSEIVDPADVNCPLWSSWLVSPQK